MTLMNASLSPTNSFSPISTIALTMDIADSVRVTTPAPPSMPRRNSNSYAVTFPSAS